MGVQRRGSFDSERGEREFSVSRVPFDDDYDDVDDERPYRFPKRSRTSQPNRDHDHDHGDDVDRRSSPSRRNYNVDDDDDDVVDVDQQSSPSWSDHNVDDDDDVDCESANTEMGSTSVTLSDPDVLDCTVCCNPLTLPVFQCDNGHIACSSCCTKIENKCPSCSGKIGYNRCRAIEKVIESVRASCCYSRYGRKEIVGYCEKLEHEKICTYVPSSCPIPDCTFCSSPRRLSLHLSQKHADAVVCFRYNSYFPVSVGLLTKLLVLREERDGFLFLLSNNNAVRIMCIDPRLSSRRFCYDIELRKGSSFLKFQSLTHSPTEPGIPPTEPGNRPTVDYLVIPGYFYTSGCYNLHICIRNKD